MFLRLIRLIVFSFTGVKDYEKEMKKREENLFGQKQLCRKGKTKNGKDVRVPLVLLCCKKEKKKKGTSHTIFLLVSYKGIRQSFSG